MKETIFLNNLKFFGFDMGAYTGEIFAACAHGEETAMKAAVKKEVAQFAKECTTVSRAAILRALLNGETVYLFNRGDIQPLAM